jgi:HYR domain-containing protein
MSSRTELRPAPPADEAAASRSLLTDIWAATSSDEFAGRVLVTASVTLAVGWIGIKEAVGVVIASQFLTEAVKNFIRRRRLSRKKIWLVTLLLLLFQLAQRAWAAISDRFRLKRRHPSRTLAPGARAAAIMSAAVAGFTVVAITVPEVAVGHQLIGHRATTFFSPEHNRANNNSATNNGANKNGGNDSGANDSRAPSPSGDAFKLALPNPGPTEATGADGARVTYSATATRGVVNCSRTSGSIFPIGTTTVRCVARAGKARVTGRFAVRVIDSEAPALQLPPGIERTILGKAITLTFVAKAFDRVDGGVPIRCSPPSGAIYRLGKTTVHCSAVDAHHNRASRNFVVDLRRPPPGTAVFALPPNLIVEATGPSGAVVSYRASAKDARGRALSVSCLPRSGSVFAVGTHPVTCSANVSGHEQKQTFPVTVRDTTNPTLQVPNSFSIEADSKKGAVATYKTAATDKVSGTLAVSCDPASGTELAIGSHAVTCTATDTAGNTARRSFNIKVFDGAPTLTVPANITRDYTKPPGATVRYPPATATDKVDGALTPTCTPRSGSFFHVGKTTVTCDVTDSGGNHVSNTFTITILDRVAPVLTVPAGITEYAPYGSSTTVVRFTASARDAIDGAVPVSCEPPSGSSFRVGNTTVTCTATDHSGNTTTKSFVVTVQPGIG